MERRGVGRCPVCQGPAVEDPKGTDGIRCRASTCIHNHASVECPRCKEKDLEGVEYVGGKYKYTCKECLNKWTVG